MTIAAVLVALVAAFLYAVASVAQQRAAGDISDESAKGLGLFRNLIHRPLWWAGFVGDFGGYGLQAVALGLGSLLLVQPLLVTALLFALPLGAAFAGRQLAASDWTWAVVLTVALAIFVLAGNPTAGVDRAAVPRWLVAAAVILPVVIGCVLGARVVSGVGRAVLLAVATGVLYGVTAALTKSVISLLGAGLLQVITNWETYVLIIAASVGTLLQQAAFQAGALEASLPAVTVLEPIVAVTLGLTLMHERIRANGPEWVLIAIAVAGMVAGTYALSRAAGRIQPVAVRS